MKRGEFCSVLLLVCSLFILNSAIIGAADYYVNATTGNDSLAGTSPTTAWQTISKVNAASFTAGDNIYFEKGETWREQLTVPSSGNSTHQITFGAYGSGSQPIISGSNLTSGWELNETNIWNITLTTQPNIVIFNGTLGTLVNYSDINESNEWNWSNNILYVYSTSDPDTAYTNPGIEAGQRNNTVFSSGKQYITLNEFHMKDGNDDTYGTVTAYNNAHNWVITNCTATNAALDGFSLTGNNVTVTNVTVTYASRFGITIGGTGHGDAIIQNSTLHDNGAASINVNSQNATIQYNLMHDDGWNTDAQAHAIYIYHGSGVGGEGTIIQYNEMYGYNIVHPTWTDSTIRVSGNNIIVRYNFIHDSHHGMDLADGEDTANNNSIYYNIFSNMTNYGIWAGGATNSTIYNNVFHGAGSEAPWGYTSLFFSDGTYQNSSENVVKNNIFYGSTYHFVVLPNQDTGFVSDNNIFNNDSGTKFYWLGTEYNLSNWNTNSGQDGNSTASDPLFTNASGYMNESSDFQP
jgi:hypothetical protein